MQKPQDVAQIVHPDIFQSECGKSLAQPLAARSFAKRRRWDFRKLTLPAAKFHFLVVQIGKSRVHPPHLCDAGYLALR
jgi:hypothetical protein